MPTPRGFLQFESHSDGRGMALCNFGTCAKPMVGWRIMGDGWAKPGCETHISATEETGSQQKAAGTQFLFPGMAPT